VYRQNRVVTDILPVEMRGEGGLFMVQIMNMELNFALRQETGKKFVGWNKIILEFCKIYR
jgi:hypothetical protein